MVCCIIIATCVTALMVQAAAAVRFPGATWEYVRPSEVGLDGDKLSDGLAALRAKHGTTLPVSVFVSRHGLAAWHGGQMPPSEKSQVWSIGKSVCALLYGVARQRGLVPSDINATIPLSNDPSRAAGALPIRNKSWFSGGAVGGPLRTWRQFLSMTSNFGLGGEPGCAYNNNAIEFYAAYLQSFAFNASSLESMVNNDLLVRVQAEDGVVLPSHLQISGYRGGMHLSSRDLARLGVLVMANGQWGDTQIIPEDFMRDAQMPQVPGDTVPSTYCGALPCVVPQTFGTDDKRWNILDESQSLPFNRSGHMRMGGDLGFGYSLWMMPQPGAVSMSGLFGQYVIVDASNDLVISVVQQGRPSHQIHAAEYLDVVRSALTSQLLLV